MFYVHGWMVIMQGRVLPDYARCTNNTCTVCVCEVPAVVSTTWSTGSAALYASPSRYRDVKQSSADWFAILLTALLTTQSRIVGKQGR